MDVRVTVRPDGWTNWGYPASVAGQLASALQVEDLGVIFEVRVSDSEHLLFVTLRFIDTNDAMSTLEWITRINRTLWRVDRDQNWEVLAVEVDHPPATTPVRPPIAPPAITPPAVTSPANGR